MDITTVVVIALLGVGAIYGILIYNHLIQLKHNVAKAWSNIDVLLKQRHDELAKLVDVCRQYLDYEQATLEKIIRARAAVASARAAGDVDALGPAETRLRAGLGQLFAVAEAYPELKADKSFRHLQERITSLENTIADRRELYNDSANLNNVRIAQFPDLMVSRLFGFGPVRLLDFSEGETADVSIRELFDS